MGGQLQNVQPCLESPLLQGLAGLLNVSWHSSLLLPTLQRTNCIKAVSENKNAFPSLTDVSEVVTDQFLCSGMEQDDSPCKGEKAVPQSLHSRGDVTVTSALGDTVSCPFFPCRRIWGRGFP